MVNKLIVIGIDGMDYDVVRRHEDILPNISKMMKERSYPRLRSVFPADTTPAWSTIFTGMDPSEHGIINFVNMGDRENKYKPISFEDDVFKGKTFWDELNRSGYKCAVLFPMNIKHGWDIDSLMITRPYENKIQIHPKEKESLYSPNPDILCTDMKFTSEKSLGALRDDFIAKSNEEFRITKAVVENEDVDLLFTYFSAVDGIQHDFWRHYDEKHPEYPGKTEFSNVVPDMYKLADSFVGELAEMCPDTPILVLSDHGHGARPVYVARVNEMLLRGGFLAPKVSGDGKKSKGGFKKFVKKTAMGFVKRFGLPSPVVKLAKKIPVWKSLFASSADFDWDKTVAYLSDLSALKNYSYGGIRIRAGATETDEEKDALCDRIIEYLRDIRIEDEDIPAFMWIKRTNTLYHGEHLDRYPEIIFQLDERYGADWNLGKELFEKQGGFMHRLSPGAHRYETAVIAAKGIELDKTQYEMTDIYKIITEYFANVDN
ncbi:MAG: alkaline phosphatase family protein [Ruminococcaceae bacterium]|nr:alkaline phosphatase family protein [Oscillospiraceae bacterium]